MSRQDREASDVVTFKTRGSIAIVILNSPRELNALRQQDTFYLSSLLRRIGTMPQITTTILTGTGRFFTVGGHVSSRPDTALDSVGLSDDEARHLILRTFVRNTLDVTRSLYTHPKILVVALNGPVVGLHAGLIGFADFVYATPHAYVLAPFASLGLVAEGGASFGFVQRMGLSLASEVLLTGRSVSSQELLQNGFVNKIFRARDEHDSEGFLRQVIEEVSSRLGMQLSQEILLGTKQMIRSPYLKQVEAQSAREAMSGMQRFMDRAPQEDFRRISKGEKRHKL